MHALIIEDEVMIAITIQDVLRKCGFTSFDIALSTEAAIEAAVQHCPDLITSDVKLRPGCGIGAVQTICAGPPIPTIYITGHASEVTRRLPAYRVLTKPFSEATLTYAVGAALAKRTGNRSLMAQPSSS